MPERDWAMPIDVDQICPGVGAVENMNIYSIYRTTRSSIEEIMSQIEFLEFCIMGLGFPFIHPITSPLELYSISLGNGGTGMVHFHPLWKLHSAQSIVCSIIRSIGRRFL